jgi:hypothetical protein
VPSAPRNVAFLLPLVIQNLAIFWNHYFGDAGIPWDFSMSYYAMVAFWTSAIGQGVFPQWIPFQQMGYPFALQLQSGINYLPLWIFPATTLTYTLKAAIVFQGLHVLAGSLGMFFLVLQVQGSRQSALIGAVAFQFFGGFYSNAEHVDIVRAYAATPWLLYVFSLDCASTGRLPLRTMLIPGVVYLFLTGAYPGNVIAAGIVLPIYVGLQVLDASARGAAQSRLLWCASCAGGLALLGTGMAAVHLGPVWLFRDQFFRGQPLSVPRVSLWLEHLPGLFLSNRTLPGEISMSSTYVSLPILILAAFTPRAAVKKYWVFGGIGLLGAVMAAGDHIAVGSYLRRAIPAFDLSRFPSSDYRVFVAIPLIIFAIAALQAIVEKQLSGRFMLVRGLLCAAWLGWEVLRVYSPLDTQSLRAVGVAALSFVAVLAFWKRSTKLTVAGAIAVSCLIAIDAAGVLRDMASWSVPHRDAYYESQHWPRYAVNRGRRLVAGSLFRNPPATRPARIEPRGLVRWAGYSDGQYYINDLTPNVLRSTSLVTASPLFHDYMRREWLPILRPPPTGSRVEVTLSDADISARLVGPLADPGGTVRQTNYGVNEIIYEVALNEPRVLVENEMFFPGWRAELGSPRGETVAAVGANGGIFRAWLLPAGSYRMVARFALPHVILLRVVSVLSLGAWVIALGGWLSGGRKIMTRRGGVRPHVVALEQVLAFLRRRPLAISFVVTSIVLIANLLSVSNKTLYGDADNYWSLARTFSNGGLFPFAQYTDRLRGYSLPFMLFGIQRAASIAALDPILVFRTVSALTGAAVFGIVLPALFTRLLGVTVTLRMAIVFAALAVVYWRGHLLYSLSDVPAVLLLAAGLLLLPAAPGGPWTIGAAALSGACLAVAANTRPVYEIALLASVALVCWHTAKSSRSRRVMLSIAAFTAGIAVVLMPQSLINSRIFGTRNPFAHREVRSTQPDLYVRQLAWGIGIQKYETNIGPNFPVAVMFLDTRGLELLQVDALHDPRSAIDRLRLSLADYLALLTRHPLFFASAYARHLFNGLDVAYSTPYVTRMSPRDLPFALFNYVMLGFAAAGGVWSLTGIAWGQYRWNAALAAAFLLPSALAIPTAIEPRFLMPLWLFACGVTVFRFPRWERRGARAVLAYVAAVVLFAIVGVAIAATTYSQIQNAPSSFDLWCIWC